VKEKKISSISFITSRRPATADEVQVVARYRNRQPECGQASGNSGDAVALLSAQLARAANARCAGGHGCCQREDWHLVDGQRHVGRCHIDAVKGRTAHAQVAYWLSRAIIGRRKFVDAGAHALQQVDGMASSGVQRDAANEEIGVRVQAPSHQPEGGRRWIAWNGDQREGRELARGNRNSRSTRIMRRSQRSAARHQHPLRVIARGDRLAIGALARCRQRSQQHAPLYLRTRSRWCPVNAAQCPTRNGERRTCARLARTNSGRTHRGERFKHACHRSTL
jgi:hypothetical protein